MHARSLFRLAGLLLAALPMLLPRAPAVAHGESPQATILPANIGALRPPVTPACISSPFGPRILPNHPLAGTFHNGIDLPAPAGAPVHAIAAGRVIRAQRRGPGGLELLVQHNGFVGIYSHLGSVAPAIAEGRLTVRPGEKIGVVGHSGVMYGMHLFFAMEREGHFVDPEQYLQLANCHAGMRRRSDMVAADGKIPPTRRIGGHAMAYAAR
ncbi:MAG TPA: M23 family metallopeptidase [Acetobacteraceae bacterium]|nr:M23 family metallopeptidase [Acetobacteraceae bacterium]